MFKKLYKSKILAFMLLVISCESSNDQGKQKPRRSSERTPTPAPDKICRSGEIKKILNDGRTVVSKFKDGNAGIIMWDAFTKEVKRKVNNAFNFLEYGYDGKYILQGVSKSFQLLGAFNNDIEYIEKFRFYRGTDPRLFFSHIDDYVYSKVKLYRNRFLVNIYDIKNRDFIFSKSVDNLKKIDMYSENNLSYVYGTSRWGNSLKTYDLERNESKSFKVKSGRVNKLVLTENLVTIEINNRFYVYDRFNGDFEHSFKVDFIYNVDRFSEVALGAIDRQLAMIDLKSGKTSLLEEKFDNAILSSCKLNFKNKEFVCKSSEESNKLVIHNFDSRKTSTVCY